LRGEREREDVGKHEGKRENEEEADGVGGLWGRGVSLRMLPSPCRPPNMRSLKPTEVSVADWRCGGAGFASSRCHALLADGKSIAPLPRMPHAEDAGTSSLPRVLLLTLPLLEVPLPALLPLALALLQWPRIPLVPPLPALQPLP